MKRFTRMSCNKMVHSPTRYLSVVFDEKQDLNASEKSILLESATSAHNYHPIPVVLNKGKVREQ